MKNYAIFKKTGNSKWSNNTGSQYTYNKKKHRPGYLSPAFLLYTEHTNTAGTPLRVDSPHSKAEKQADEFASKYANRSNDTQTTSAASSFTENTATTVQAYGNGGFTLNQSQQKTVHSALADTGSPLPEKDRVLLEQHTGETSGCKKRCRSDGMDHC